MVNAVIFGIIRMIGIFFFSVYKVCIMVQYIRLHCIVKLVSVMKINQAAIKLHVVDTPSGSPQSCTAPGITIFLCERTKSQIQYFLVKHPFFSY